MRSRPSFSAAFTLLEIITAISVIVILIALIVSISGSRKPYLARAAGEIAAISMACDSYKADNGAYPMDIVPGGAGFGVTDQLSPKEHFDPTNAAYENSNLFLYKEITGDKAGGTNGPDGLPDTGEHQYLKEFDSKMLKADRDAARRIIRVRFIQDPWGYPYGYSTAAAHEEMVYQQELKEKGASATRVANSRGFNPTFDLWCTAGSKSAMPSSNSAKELEWAKWEKNWK